MKTFFIKFSSLFSLVFHVNNLPQFTPLVHRICKLYSMIHSSTISCSFFTWCSFPSFIGVISHFTFHMLSFTNLLIFILAHASFDNINSHLMIFYFLWPCSLSVPHVHWIIFAKCWRSKVLVFIYAKFLFISLSFLLQSSFHFISAKKLSSLIESSFS